LFPLPELSPIWPFPLRSVELLFPLKLPVTVPVEISRITVAVEIADALGIGIRILDVEVVEDLAASVRSHRHLLRELETPVDFSIGVFL
jgi:hypothetical protein